MDQINGCPRAAGLMLLQPFCKFIFKSVFFFCYGGSIDRVAFSIAAIGMITMMVFVVVVVVDWMVLLLVMEMVNRTGSEPPGPPHVERPAGPAFIP